VVGALIGGLLMITVAPTYLMDRMPYLTQPGTVILPGNTAGGTTPGTGTAVEKGTVAYAAEAVGPAVVGILNKATAYDIFRRAYTSESSGSGVIFHKDGYIVTNNHVVEGATELVVSLADGRVLTGTIVGTDAFTDLAVVKISATDLPVAAFGDSDALRVGEVAIAIGNPVGLEFARTVTAGVISGINRLVQQGERTFTLVQTDAAINPGNSGGPLCNGSGQVIGINTIKFASTEIEGMSFAIPINIVRPIVNDLVVNGRIIRPWLGVRIVDKANAARYGVTLDKGVLVIEVVSRGPAANAGIQVSDVIIAVAGQTVNTTAELTAAVQTHRVGEKIEVKILRRGSELTYTVTLAEMQSD
jgi:serine protease Do